MQTNTHDHRNKKSKRVNKAEKKNQGIKSTHLNDKADYLFYMFHVC